MAEKNNSTEDLADRVFRALSSRPRREVLAMLAWPPDGDCCSPEGICACDISKHLGLSPSTVSHHMKILQEAELVSARKKGLWVYYSPRCETLMAVCGDLGRLVSGYCKPESSDPPGDAT